MPELTEQKGKKFFIYLRQSKAGNSDYTFDLQFASIKQFAQQRGIMIDESSALIKQEDASAYEGSRKKFDEMMKELEKDSAKSPEKRIYAGILFFNVSRIARNSEDFLKVENLMKLDYKMLSATENIIDSASGMYFFRMVQIESIYYSDRQSSKSQSYNLHILSREPRKAIGGNGATYGYDVRNSEVKVHPVNSLVVKRIFELRNAGKGNDVIADILIKEFAKKVEQYNESQLKEKPDGTIRFLNDSGDEVEDMNNSSTISVESDESDNGTRKKEEIRIRASIPNSGKISDILNGRFSIQYNGKRRCKINLTFAEDINLYNLFLKSNQFTFKFKDGNEFKKWENIVIIDIPELRIIENEVFDKVLLEKVSKERTEGGHIYKGIAFCACGGQMRAKVEWNLWRVYYQCENAKKQKDGIQCKNTTRIEEGEISTFVQTRIFPYLKLKEGTKEYQDYLKDVLLYTTGNLENRLKTEIGALTKFKTSKKNATNAKVLEDYTDKIREKTILIDNLKDELAEKRERSKADFIHLFEKFDTFLSLNKEEQSDFARKVFKWIRLDEDHTEEFRYDNQYNRRSIQYQKITSFELEWYFQTLFDMNFPHEPT